MTTALQLHNVCKEAGVQNVSQLAILCEMHDGDTTTTLCRRTGIPDSSVDQIFRTLRRFGLAGKHARDIGNGGKHKGSELYITTKGAALRAAVSDLFS